ncbi:MAG: PHP domain-containing protein [Firmicutes bacterium]|nr:PHP domain-containing protein [Bacillota bacterium]
MSADLHVHSTASDGTLTPEEIVNQAVQSGLSAISLTDHDTVDGIYSALRTATGKDLELVPGIELNTDWEGIEVHILGYYIEFQAGWFQQALNDLRNAREERAAAMIGKLKKIGISLSPARVKEIAGPAPIGRPHIAQALIEAGYVSSVEEAFQCYLGQGKPAYVARHRLSPFQAIALIRKGGGIPVLAHPGLMDRDELIPEFIKAGLLGIEVYYPRHTPEMIARYVWICQKSGLIMTGGSDSHGPGLDYPPLGTITVPDQTVADLKLLHQLLH